MATDLLAYFGRFYDVPTTADDYAKRLRAAGTGWAEAAAIAAREFPTVAPAAPEAADDGAGAGWTVLALLADGTAETVGTFGTFGAAADVAADCSRVWATAPALLRPRPVVVLAHDGAAMVAAR